MMKDEKIVTEPIFANFSLPQFGITR